ncbi:MAG: hypothetical protein NTZ05_22365 [Chloroflexi bacterium]|nr:hypothetical protein [Chloroflexota bacterium]
MVTFQPEEKTRLKRQKEEQAISLAMQSRWEDAAVINQSILEMFPNDVDSYNRLGKALTELGRYGAARSSYGKSLELDPSNSIARRNHQRLAGMKETSKPVQATTAKVDPRLFIEERGKTAVVVLQQPAPREVISRVNAGDLVGLKTSGRTLMVETSGGVYLGRVEPKLAMRVIKMMQGGNKYAAAVTSIADGAAKVIIKEVFQSPTLAGQVSFPGSADSGGVRPYTRDSLLKYGYEDEEEYQDENDDSWDEDGGSGGGGGGGSGSNRRGSSWTAESDDLSPEDASPLPEDDDRDDNEEE